MCTVTVSVGVTIQVFLLVIFIVLVPSVYSRCGCHKVPGQGFFANRQAANHNFEPLPQAIQAGSDDGNVQYSVPNFRVLLFQPTFLDFREQAVGMPYVQSVVLSNPSDQNDIEITAINALPPFHGSRFSKKVLAPLTNMTIDLVFLATMVGNVEHTVYIYTSRGNFPYQVFGVGNANPYRLRAFVSARIPINGTFSPYINIYNPFSEAIQISEMYSSGSDLHLDLLGNNNNNDSISKLWEIPPYETKAVMKATFFSNEEGIAVRFIRIVIGPPAPVTDVLILPFEMVVSKKPGLYTNIDMLDFGTLRTMDESKSLNLNALNFGNKSLQIVSIQVVPPNKAVVIQFMPTVLKHSRKYMKIATITYSALLASHKRQNNGKIVVVTADEKKKMEVPYQANVLHGTLAYSIGKTSFFVGNSPKTQMLTITNTFNMTLVIYNATIPTEAQSVFSIANFSKAIMVPPGKLISPLSLNFKTNESDLSLSTVLRLFTNASIFTIPVHCYNGKLKYRVDSLSEDVLDFGTVGTFENRTLTFRIINDNPVEVSIKEYGTKFEFARLRLLHLKNMKKMKNTKRTRWVHQRNNSTSKDTVQKNSTQSMNGDLILKPSDIATFVIDVTAPQKEGTYHGEIAVKTIYQKIQIPIYLKTVKGSLIAKPKRIKIEKAFPGRMENYPISIESTFEYAIALKNLSVFPEDPRFQFNRPDFLPKLPPGQKTHIGWIKFDPFYGDENQCYVCLCEIDSACENWHHSLPLAGDTWELDFNLLEKLRRKWDIVESKQESSFNASIIIDSTIIKRYTIPVQASLAWPNLVEQSIKFPPTHVGNYSIEFMVITNPSDQPLVVQVVPLLHYPQPEGGLDLLSDRLIMDSFSLDLNGHSQFFLPEIKDVYEDHKKISAALNVYPSPNSLSMLLEPREKKTVQVGFVPDDETAKTSIMVVRNNLTILDLVVVHGQGAHTYFDINGKKPGSKSSVLLFEIKPVHLKDCNKSTPKARVYPSFTVKRSFTAMNVGLLPVHVVSMNINSYECEGYGFRILNCESFILLPNASRKIDITFIPDFTTSRVTRTLKVLTTMGQSLDYTLLATLPHHLLPLCANALPRPFWEPYLHMIAAVVMSTVFIFIIFFAYFDAQKYVVQCTFTAASGRTSSLTKNLDVYTAGTVFDLKAIAGVKVRIADKVKKENYPGDCKLHQRVMKNNSTGNSLKTNLSNGITKSNESASNRDRDRSRSFSDSSSNSTSSRKNSNTLPAPPLIPEEKPETKPTKDSGDTPPRQRTKKKSHEPNRFNAKYETYEEPRETVIITEEIRDPWDREQMEKVRIERQKQKNKYENNDESEKQKNRKKSKLQKKEIHQALQKENSNSSSNAEEDRVDEKPPGFTTVQGKTKTKKKIADIPTPSYYSNTLDKLDEISLSGPRPDAKDMPRTSTKTEHKSKTTQPRKKLPFQHERLIMDTPTSPHAIAAAIVEAALVKSQQKKKTKGKGDKSGSTPTSPSALSAGSRSSSYSSIIQELTKGVRSVTPSGILNDISPSTSNKGSPKHQVYEDAKPSSAYSSPRRIRKETGGGFSSYFRRFGFGKSEPTNSENSMFYYDNLTSLRASKRPYQETDTFPNGFPTRNDMSTVASTLSPDSAEFVPASQRINKAVGSNLKKDNSWATVDDSALEHLRPPPGLSRPAPRNIWGSEEDRWGSSTQKKSSLFDFNSDYKSDGGYSSLLGRSKDLFSSFDFLGLGNRDDPPSSLWKTTEPEFPSIDQDLWGGSSSRGVRTSIWDTPDPLIPTISTSAPSSARSRLGLDLNLKPAGEVRDTDSPLDAFSIWANVDSTVSPYEGWNEDIKEEE